ncbi:MAG: pseudouridine synthase [Clostridiaceae bacterium]|nr:pseudouridine synthase [Clostridiaceae bacterium]
MIRLDKFVSSAGGVSRAQAQVEIRSGKVTVFGEICKAPEKKVEEGTDIRLDGQLLFYDKYIYIMMDKPKGYLSATEDTRDPSVTELLLPEHKRRSLGIVGRLDKDTTGLLILTDDGELNHRLTSPKYHLDKVYEAELDIEAEESDIGAFALGMDFKDFTAMPAKLEIDLSDRRRCRVTIGEGKFHQVKRMFERCGKSVVELRRVSMGGLLLDGELRSGGSRLLKPCERDYLLKKCGLKQ